MARKRMYFSAAKAVRELGLPQTDVRVALRDAVEWFAAHGYARARGAAASDEPVDAERARHAQEPLELLLRASSPCRGRGARRCTPCTPSAAPSTTSPTSAATRRRSGRAASCAGGWRQEVARVLRARRRPEHPIARQLAEAVRAYADPARGAGGDHRRGARWISTADRLRDGGGPLSRTAIASPPRSASAASRSSATRIRGRASTRSTSAWRCSSRTSSATWAPTRARGASTCRRRTCARSASPSTDLRGGAVHRRRSRALMAHQAERARELLPRGAGEAFPAADARSLVPAQIMGRDLLRAARARSRRAAFASSASASPCPRARKVAIALALLGARAAPAARGAAMRAAVFRAQGA